MNRHRSASLNLAWPATSFVIRSVPRPDTAGSGSATSSYAAAGKGQGVAIFGTRLNLKDLFATDALIDPS
jgi:hypothetical protein